MAIYKLIVVFLCFCAFIYSATSKYTRVRKPYTINGSSSIECIKKGDKAFLLFFMGSLIIIRFLINPQSLPDTWYYADNFSSISRLDWKSILVDGGNYYGIPDEKGFIALSKIISYISKNDYIYIGIIGVIIISFYYLLIRDYSPLVWFSCVLFLLGSYNQSLFVLRQYIAMGIVYCSFPYIVKKDLKRFLLLIVLAFFFHRSSIVCIPFYFIYSIKDVNKVFAVTIASIIVARVALALIFSYILQYFGDLQSYLSDEDGANFTMIVYLCALLVLRLLILKNHFWESGITRLFSSALILAVAFAFLSYGFGFDRVVVYYSSLLCIIFPQTIMFSKSRFLRYGLGLLFVISQLYLWHGSLAHLETIQFL